MNDSGSGILAAVIASLAALLVVLLVGIKGVGVSPEWSTTGQLIARLGVSIAAIWFGGHFAKNALLGR